MIMAVVDAMYPLLWAGATRYWMWLHSKVNGPIAGSQLMVKRYGTGVSPGDRHPKKKALASADLVRDG